MKLEILGITVALGAGIAAKALDFHIWPFALVAGIAGPILYFQTSAYKRLAVSARLYRRPTIIGEAAIYALVGSLALMAGYALAGGRGL